jgi:hypothetical protein
MANNAGVFPKDFPSVKYGKTSFSKSSGVLISRARCKAPGSFAFSLQSSGSIAAGASNV